MSWYKGNRAEAVSSCERKAMEGYEDFTLCHLIPASSYDNTRPVAFH